MQFFKYATSARSRSFASRKVRDCVRAGTCGVRIVTRYVDQSGSARSAGAVTSGVGDDAITLDAGVSERALDLRDAIAEDQAKLEYLQQYADQCKELGGKPVKRQHRAVADVR